MTALRLLVGFAMPTQMGTAARRPYPTRRERASTVGLLESRRREGMWRRTSRSFVLLAISTLVAVGSSSVAGESSRTSPLPPAPGPFVLVDATSGQVLRARNPDQRWFPASLTKLATLYVVFRGIDESRLELTQLLTVSSRAASQPETRLGLRRGGKLLAQTAIEAVATVSSNDAAVVLAEAISGSEEAFVAEMNEAARGLGLHRTKFRNATGLPGPGQWTTARDMAQLARALHVQFAEHRGVFALRSIVYEGRTRGTHNGPLSYVKGSDGLKTGFTCDAGYNIILSVERAARRLIVVVLGARSRHARDRFASRLIAEGFAPPRLAPLVLDAGPAAANDAPTYLGMAHDPLPPQRLGAEQCHPGQHRRDPPWVIEASRLRGWGIFLGIYREEKNARAQLSVIRNTLAGAQPPTTNGRANNSTKSTLPRSAQTALLPRNHGTNRTWKLVIAGLSQTQAGETCKQLTAHGAVCVAQSPARLSMLGYASQ